MTDETSTERLVAKRIKAKTNAKEDTRTTAEKEIDAALEASEIGKSKALARRKMISRAIKLGLVAFLVCGIYYLFAPFKGSRAYGVCRVFLELNVKFPDELILSSIEDFPTSVRIWYVQVDSFGEHRLEPIQCFFKQGPSEDVPYILEKVLVDRRPVDQRKVDEFNKSVPTIFQNMPDLTIPSPLPDSLSDLKLETDKFRKRLF